MIIQFFHDKVFISPELVREFGTQILNDWSNKGLAFFRWDVVKALASSHPLSIRSFVALIAFVTFHLLVWLSDYCLPPARLLRFKEPWAMVSCPAYLTPVPECLFSIAAQKHINMYYSNTYYWIGKKKNSFIFSHNGLQKNTNELFGQPIIYIYVTWYMCMCVCVFF